MPHRRREDRCWFNSFASCWFNPIIGENLSPTAFSPATLCGGGPLFLIYSTMWIKVLFHEVAMMMLVVVVALTDNFWIWFFGGVWVVAVVTLAVVLMWWWWWCYCFGGGDAGEMVMMLVDGGHGCGSGAVVVGAMKWGGYLWLIIWLFVINKLINL